MIIIQVKNKGDEMRSFFTKIIFSAHPCKITCHQRMSGLQPDFSSIVRNYTLNLLKLTAFNTTVTDDAAMAAEAIIGFIGTPRPCKAPAAMGIDSVL